MKRNFHHASRVALLRQGFVGRGRDNIPQPKLESMVEDGMFGIGATG